MQMIHRKELSDFERGVYRIGRHNRVEVLGFNSSELIVEVLSGQDTREFIGDLEDYFNAHHGETDKFRLCKTSTSAQGGPTILGFKYIESAKEDADEKIRERNRLAAEAKKLALKRQEEIGVARAGRKILAKTRPDLAKLLED